LGVWPDISHLRISPYTHMHVWDSEGDGAITFSAAQTDLPQLGHIIENNVLCYTLAERLQTQENVTLYWQQPLQTLSSSDTEVTLQTTTGETFVSRCLIGADGALSKVREQNAMPIREWDYQHQAIVATVQTALAHEKTAYQRFMPKGPLALLPLADPHLCSIVWSTETEHAQTLLALSDAEFNAEITQAFDHHLSDITVQSERWSFPLRMRHANNYCKDRIVLIGDAAHTIHPLAGQGANLGLADAEALAEALLAAHARERDIGSQATLRRYERSRKGANWQMVAGMEALKQLFATTQPLVKIARNKGLTWVDQSDFVKQLFMHKAAGL
jgi:2-polyprenylphenol 6-hydroxylase